MSMLFRFIASISRSLSEALVPASLLILGLVLYTGFALPVKYMLRWISASRSHFTSALRAFAAADEFCFFFLLLLPPYALPGWLRWLNPISQDP